MAPRILIFSIAMGANYSFYVKIIVTHARAFFKVIIFTIDSVTMDGSTFSDFSAKGTGGLQQHIFLIFDGKQHPKKIWFRGF